MRIFPFISNLLRLMMEKINPYINDGENSGKILGNYAIGGKSTEIGYVYKESMIPYFFLRFLKVYSVSRRCPFLTPYMVPLQTLNCAI